MTNSRLDVNAEKAKGIFENSHHHGRIFLFSGGSTHQWEKSQRVLTFLTQNGSFFRKNFHDREPVETTRESQKILADGKQVFFAVGDIDSSQDKWTPVFQTIENSQIFAAPTIVKSTSIFKNHDKSHG